MAGANAVDVRFRTRRLERCFEHINFAVREWGPDVGSRYVERIRAMRRARAFEYLYGFRALDLHPLRGDRRGQYAIRLTGRMRLIVERGDDVETVIVVEVVDYHD